MALGCSNAHALALSEGAAQAPIVCTGSTGAYFVNTRGAGPNLSLHTLLLVRMVGAARASAALLLCCAVLLRLLLLLMGSIVVEVAVVTVVGLWLIS